MSWRRAMAAALSAMLGRGSWWVVALAGFLVRGGLLLALPAIVMPPTTAELGGLLDPSLVGTGLANPTPALVALVAGTLVALVATLTVTTVIGAWLEVTLVEAAADDAELAAVEGAATRAADAGADAPVDARVDGPADAGREGAPSSDRSNRISVAEASIARLVAHVPTVGAAAVALVALGAALTDEVTSPGGSGPLALRVLGRVPLPVVAVVVLWLLGEAWGGIAVRRLRTGETVGRALGRGLAELVRPSGLATFVVGTLAVALPAAALWFAASRAFDRLWPLLVDNADEGLVTIALVLLVATWAVGLWLLAIGLAWRSTAWTAEVLRRT
jgi:hypothetical protein